jgi:hypothetical protein
MTRILIEDDDPTQRAADQPGVWRARADLTNRGRRRRGTV